MLQTVRLSCGLAVLPPVRVYVWYRLSIGCASAPCVRVAGLICQAVRVGGGGVVCLCRDVWRSCGLVVCCLPSRLCGWSDLSGCACVWWAVCLAVLRWSAVSGGVWPAVWRLAVRLSGVCQAVPARSLCVCLSAVWL